MGKITANDRLIFTLLFSVIIHLVIVLGVSFQATSPLTNSPQISLDITLVKQQTEEAPEQADFLAQVNNEGGGESEQKSPEPSPESSVTPKEEASSVSPPANSKPVAKQTTPPQLEIPTKEVNEPIPTKKPAAKIEVEPQTSPSKAIVQKKATRIVTQALEQAEERQNEVIEESAEPPKLNPRQLILPNQYEISQLEKKFDAAARALSKRPKKRQISAATKEYSAAAYMKSWEMKVERIGNFNYPQEAKRQGINGALMLTVDINPDGSVPADGIVVSRSSGHKILDDAAVRIVRLGAPYATIPENVLQGNDMLTIIRTWKFETNRGLSTR